MDEKPEKARGGEGGIEKPQCVVIAEEGHGLLRAGKAAEAEKRYRLALNLHPKHPEHLFDLSGALRAQDRYQEALGMVRKAQRADGGNPFFYGPIANLYIRLGKYSDAQKAAYVYCAFHPRDPAGLRDLADAYYHTFQHIKALRAYKRLMRFYPRDLEILNGLGCTYGELGRGDKALKVWKRCLEIDPTDQDTAESIRRAEAASSPHREQSAATPLIV